MDNRESSELAIRLKAVIDALDQLVQDLAKNTGVAKASIDNIAAMIQEQKQKEKEE